MQKWLATKKLVQGTIPDPPKNKIPDSIRYRSLVEEQK
jgi:hypothetical protein